MNIILIILAAILFNRDMAVHSPWAYFDVLAICWGMYRTFGVKKEQ